MSRPDGGGGGGSVVMGPHMQRLTNYVNTFDSESFATSINQWRDLSSTYRDQATYLDHSAKAVPEAFHHSSYIGTHGHDDFSAAAKGSTHKSGLIMTAHKALNIAHSRATEAKAAHAKLMASLPSSLGPAPDPNDPQYKQSGIGIDPGQAAQNRKALAADQAAHQAKVSAINDAEREAAHHIQQVDEGFAQARPPVRAIYEAPEPSDGGGASSGAGGGGGGGFAPSYPGSRSQVVAAQAKIDATDRYSRYAEGSGASIHEQQHAIIQQAMAENRPEWDPSQGMWINADGTPADPSSYSAVMANGEFTPMSAGGHSLSMSAMAGIGVGAGVIGVGAFAAARSGAFGETAARIAGGTVKAGAVGKVDPKLAAVNKAGGRAGYTSGKSSGSRGGAGSRSNMTRAGSRAGAAGARGGKGKDKKGKGKSAEYLADYTEDWLDPDYKPAPPVVGDRSSDSDG